MRNPFAGISVLAFLVAVAITDGSASAATCLGSCGQATAADGVVTMPSDGNSYYRWISTSGGSNGVGQLGIGGTNGTTYTTSPFSATAGAVLNYNFNYVTSDGSLGGGFIYADYAWAQLQDTAHNVIATLLTARTQPTGTIIPGFGLPGIAATLNPGSVPINGAGYSPNTGPLWSPLGSSSGTCWGDGCGYTGWVNSQYTLSSTGTFVLVFGVTNWGDTAWDSGLAFSGLTVGSVGIPGEAENESISSDIPEPSTWAMLILGFAGIGLMAYRRRPRPGLIAA